MFRRRKYQITLINQPPPQTPPTPTVGALVAGEIVGWIFLGLMLGALLMQVFA